MKKKNYLVIGLICTIVIVINYLTDFMFKANNETLIFIWTFFNIIVFPIWITYYIYGIAKLNKKRSFVFIGVIGIISYLLTYIVPFIDYFNFQTLALNGDGATNAILTGIMFIGLIVISISFVIFHIKLIIDAKSDLKREGV